MFAIYAFCRAVDDIADDGRRPRRAARRSSTNGARSRRSLRRTHPRALRLSEGAGAALRSRSRRFRGGDRRHGDGRRRRHSRARLGDARSLLRPCRQRGRPAFGAHLRPRGMDACSPITSGARCNSPIFCAISTRTRGAGGCICPRRRCSTAGIAEVAPASRAGASRARRRLRRRGCACARALRPGRRRDGRLLEARGPRARADGRRLWLDPRPSCRAGLRAAARAGSRLAIENRSGAAALLSPVSATVHIVGAGLAGLSCAVRLAGEGRRVVAP